MLKIHVFLAVNNINLRYCTIAHGNYPQAGYICYLEPTRVTMAKNLCAEKQNDQQ
jgi:hypothetical protein